MAKMVDGEMVQAALSYARDGWPVFPLHHASGGRCSCGDAECGSPGKHPLSPHGFKDATKDPAKIRSLWERHPRANVGIATGRASGLVVLDIDPRNGGTESLAALEREVGALPVTRTVKTGGGGEHRFFRRPDGDCKSAKGFRPGLDLKSDGGYVVAAPSSHSSGRRYQWVDPAQRIASAPAKLLSAAAPRSRPSVPVKSEPVVEGKRNDFLAQVAGGLRRQGLEGDALYEALLAINEAKCSPPLKEAEVKGIAASISKYPEKDVESQATQIARLGEDCELFHDENRQPYARIEVSGHKEQWPCDSTQFRQHLAYRTWKQNGKAPGSEALSAAENIIAAKALFEGPQVRLHNRIARADGAFYYDLTDADWRAVKITPGKWEAVPNPPILFRRYEHQRPQVLPARPGDARRVLEFVNIQDDAQRTLFLVSMVAMFVPDIAHPVLIPHGEQGAAKSSMLRLLRRLIDPSAVELLTFPRDPRSLVMQFYHCAAPMYDNVSRLDHEDSDAVCRAVTGDGVITRKLFRDQDEVIFHFRRSIGINGINVVATQPDLLDRSILFGLDPIQPGARKTEEELDAAFERARPFVLGGIFDALAKAMALKKTITPSREFRMADFVHWGCAIADALGLGRKSFLAAYRKNINGHTGEAISNSPVASVIVEFMKTRSSWTGTATKLFAELEAKAIALGISRHGAGWPAAPNALGRRLNEVRTILRRVGLEVVITRDSERHITIRKRVEVVEVDESGEEVAVGSDSSDGVIVEEER